MKINFVYIIIILVSTNLCFGQTWEQMEKEYFSFYNENNFSSALKKSKEMLNKYVKTDGATSLKVAICYGYIGSAYEELSNDSSLLFYQKGIDIVWKLRNLVDEEIAMQLENFASIAAIKNYKMGVAMYLRSIEIFKELKSSYLFLVIPLKGLRDLYYSKGDYYNAQIYSQQISEIYLKENGANDTLYADAMADVALNYFRMADYAKSEKCFLIAIDASKKIRGEYNIPNAFYLNNLANLYLTTGRYFEADKLYNEVLHVKGKLYPSDNENYYFTLNDQAVLFERIGRYKEAESNYKLVIELSIKPDGKLNEYYAMATNNLSGLELSLGKYEIAEEYANKAINAYKQLKGEKHPYYISALSNLARIYKANKNYVKALELGKYILGVRKEIYGEEHPEYANSLELIATIYLELGQIVNAEITQKAASLIYAKHFEENIRYDESLQKLASIYMRLGELQKADSIFKKVYESKVTFIAKNFTFLSESEREEFWKSETYFFEEINSFTNDASLRNQSDNQLAYNASLLSKSILMQSSKNFDDFVITSTDSNLIRISYYLKLNKIQYAKLSSEGNTNDVNLARLRISIDSLDRLLARKMSVYADYKKNFSLTWKDVQTNLVSDEASIEFARYYDYKDSIYRYMALIVKPEDKFPQLVKLCSRQELIKLSPENELSEIYSLIWKPIADKLEGVKTIYYAPEGLINNIPLHALYQEKDGVREYLMDKYSLNQLTSTRYLALGLKKRTQEPIETSIALFGGVNYNDFPISKSDNSNLSSEAAFLYKNAVTARDLEDTRSGASYLPGTKKEVENIADLLKNNKWDVNVSEGKNASEDKVKNLVGKNSKSILHIATHGFAFPVKENNRKRAEIGLENGNERYKVAENPMIRSGLLFSGSNMTWQGKGDSLLKMTNEDGVLTAYELSQLSLDNTKLVVLSACETGKGAIQGSEGTFGLKRALKLAGVDNMIVSLWKVPDDETMEMMTLFYTELAKSKKPVSSFESAQRVMRLKYPTEPKKWAGFVFVR